MANKTLEHIKPWLPVTVALIVSLAIALFYRVPIGEDIHFHLKIAADWRNNGLLGWFSETAFEQNKMPYPPLLHILLLFIDPLTIQIGLLPLAVWSFSKLYTGRDRLLAGVLVLSSYAYVDRIMQVNPQAITMILLPLAILYYIQNERHGFIAVSSLMIWTHGIVALSCLGGLFFQMLRRRQYKTLALILLLTAPVLATTFLYLPTTLEKFTSGFENNQERQFWSNPLFTVLYQRLLFSGFFVAAAFCIRRRQVSDLEKTALLTLSSMALMIISWADRFVQLSTIPLAILIMENVKRRDWRGREAWTWAITFCFFFMYATLWLWLIADVYYIV